jgi:hypothetical protein
MQRDSKGLIGRVVALFSLCLAVGEAVAVAHGVIRQHKRILHTAKRHGSPGGLLVQSRSWSPTYTGSNDPNEIERSPFRSQRSRSQNRSLVRGWGEECQESLRIEA